MALECAGLRDWYTTWLFEVFFVPLALWFLAGVFYAFRQHSHDEADRAKAKAKLKDDTFLVLFIVYPFVTNRLFVMLNCRTLSDTESVLVDNYSVDCNTNRHTAYQAISVVAIILFSLGVPVGIAVGMMISRKRQKEQFRTPTWRYIARKAMVQLGHDDLRETKYAMIDITLGSRFGSLVSAYNPGFFYFECIDMLRKLVLVGMLTIVPAGSTLQVSTGLTFSFAFFAAHIRTLPFRFSEDNWLKATTECHLFVILVLVLTLKSQPRGETLGTSDYDMLATVSFIVLVPVAAAFCVVVKWRTVTLDQVEVKTMGKTEQLKLAFKRQRQGRDKSDDRELLAAYFSKLHDEISNDYHIFISYRVASEAAFAKKLHDQLSAMTLSETGQKLRVYLDQVRLEDGERWDEGFMTGLASSWVAVPLVSTKGLQPMLNLTSESKQCDNVLLEWTAALELNARGQLQAIIPVIACDESDIMFDWGLPRQLTNTEHVATTTQVKKHLLKHPSSDGMGPNSDELIRGVAQTVSDISTESTGGEVTTAGVVAAILRFQGVLLAERADVDTAASRIFEKVTQILNVGADQLQD